MTDHEYRYSIIPGGAVTDPRLEHGDVRVLALLGRHGKLGGWCWRSQVKMAAELKCGRATIQRALDRLVGAGWVEKRLRGRGDTPPDATKQPFAAYAYRAKLDNEVPAELLAVVEGDDDDGCPQTGTPDDGHQGARPDGHQGAHLSGHPNEGTLSEGTPEESERDARARDAEDETPLPHVGAFNRRWPTASSDDQRRTKAAWDALTADERQACLDGIDPFIKKSKADGRSHIIAGWRYIEEKRWALLPETTAKPQHPNLIPSWSREWWAALFRRIERRQPTDFMLRMALQGSDWAAERQPIDAATAAALQAYPNDGQVMDAWRPWFKRHRVDLPEWHKRFWVYLPGPEPGVSEATGPPSTTAA